MIQTISVLIGGEDTNDAFCDLILDIVSAECGNRCDVHVRGIVHSERIASYMAAERVDVFVPFVNSIVFPTGNMPPEIRIEQAIAFVSRITESFCVPVIEMSGVPLREQLLRGTRITILMCHFGPLTLWCI